MTCAFTVLNTTGGLFATKQICRDPGTGEITVIGYPNPKHFAVRVMEIDGFNGMATKLDALAGDPRAFIIRAAPKAGIDWQRTRRLFASRS